MNDTYSIHSPMLLVEVRTGHTIISAVESVGVKNEGGRGRIDEIQRVLEIY